MAVASVSEDLKGSEPFHPDKKFVFPKKKYGSRLRSCQAHWFEDYPFLHYDVGKDALFCHVCVKAVAEKKMLTSTKPDPAFVSVSSYNVALSKLN